MKIELLSTSSINASIIRGLLETEGISCSTNDDALNQLLPTNTNVRLYVEKSDAERARLILSEHDLP